MNAFHPRSAAQLADMQKASESATLNGIIALMDRLADVLAEENTALEARQPVNHDTFISRKNQLLRDLIVLQRNMGQVQLSETAIARMRQVRELVDRNNHLLKLQVEAMAAVTSLLTEAALAEDADGTYSRGQQ